MSISEFVTLRSALERGQRLAGFPDNPRFWPDAAQALKSLEEKSFTKQEANEIYRLLLMCNGPISKAAWDKLTKLANG